MSADDIATLPVETAAEDRAHLYLWTTNAFMAEAHELAKAWGFVPKTIITWVKIKQGGERFGDVRIGMGHYWRNATEHVLFCVRGKPALKTLRRNQPTVFFAERSQHSAKPQEFYDLVEGMSPGPRLELFARTPRDGWAVWGDEVRDWTHHRYGSRAQTMAELLAADNEQLAMPMEVAASRLADEMGATK